MTEKRANMTLEPFVRKLQAADARGHRNLTLVPVAGGESGERLDYMLAADAIEAGTLTVTEVDESGSVPELLAVNESDRMVLLLDGEELVGAKQNRVLNTSILLRPQSKTKIPVSCVEQGRWRHISREFSSGSYSPAGLRARKSRDVGRSLRARGEARSDQGAVWDEVAHCMVALGTASPTDAMSDAFEQRQKSFDAYVAALPYPKGARGVVAAIDGRFAAADIFDKAETLQRVWPRLITGYALDALGRRGPNPGTFSARATEVLLEHVGETDCHPCPSAGIGKDWRFEAEDILGQALVAQRTCVHLSIFPNDTDDGRHRTPGPRILPPSRRRGRRGSRGQGDDVVR